MEDGKGQGREQGGEEAPTPPRAGRTAGGGCDEGGDARKGGQGLVCLGRPVSRESDQRDACPFSAVLSEA